MLCEGAIYVVRIADRLISETISTTPSRALGLSLLPGGYSTVGASSVDDPTQVLATGRYSLTASAVTFRKTTAKVRGKSGH